MWAAMRSARLVLMAGLAMLASSQNLRAVDGPERVTFLSADGKTTLTGYLFAPQRRRSGGAPAVVMMHGRSGPYSTAANGVYDATTLSQRHLAWGQLLASEGYLALLVDGFGPRGHAQGFPPGSYMQRPAAVSEIAVRPLDAYGALAYLRTRTDVLAGRVALLGWSNGASAALVAMDVNAPGITAPTPTSGFRAALAFYPACGLRGRYDVDGYRAYAPVRVFHGTADQEVSATRCRLLVERSRRNGTDIAIRLYRGATHGFDDPGERRQRVEANAIAREDSMERALAFLAQELMGDPPPRRSGRAD